MTLTSAELRRMRRIFITGSSDGLGLMAAQLLAQEGHAVTLHARNEARASDASRALPDAEAVLIADISTIAGMRGLAEQANALGRYDAVIHNAGVGYREPRRIVTDDGLAHIFAINVLAPYLLTALMLPAERLVYLSSGMHVGGDPSLEDLQWENRRWNGAQAYSDSKLFDVVLAFAVARKRPQTLSNALEPWLGPDENGWRRCAGRHGARTGHAGLACLERRSGRQSQRPILQVSEDAPRKPGCQTRRGAGRAPRLLRRTHGTAARVANDRSRERIEVT